MASSSREKFDAAVKVIRGLPQNGSFQPSNEMMLKFYAYYKQATEGPCTSPKPSMWNMVNRKKWEAWAGLGPMEKETAMLRYVEELKHIVETMPQTEQVADFVDTLGSFYELIDDSGKDSPLKAAKRPNGSASVNGGGDENGDHSADVSGAVRHSTEDSRRNHVNGRGDNHSDDVPHSAGPPLIGSLSGVPVNGIDIIVGEEEEEESDYEEEDDKEKEEDDKEKRCGSTSDAPLDSGSDGEEYCDTSDHMEQVVEPSTSTPSGRRSDNRVRFAADVSVADDTGSFIGYDSSHDHSAAHGDMSTHSSQMEQERVKEWVARALSRLSPRVRYPPLPPTESLYVNTSSSSSLPSRGINDIDSTLDEDERYWMGTIELMMCRGGEDESAGSNRTTSPGRGAGNSSSRGGRGGAYQGDWGGSGMRHSHSPSGQGGGDPHGRGQDRHVTSLDQQILLALMQLQQNVASINDRLAALEMSINLQREEEAKNAQRESMWWPFQSLSKKWVAFLIVWPFLTPLIVNFICRRRLRSSR